MVDCTPKGEDCQGDDLHNLYLVYEDWLVYSLREDKSAAEADTLQTLRRLYERQFDYKGRLG
jgi:hypothetical protein